MDRAISWLPPVQQSLYIYMYIYMYVCYVHIIMCILYYTHNLYTLGSGSIFEPEPQLPMFIIHWTLGTFSKEYKEYL